MWDTSTIFLTALSTVIGFLGIILAGKAVDTGMEIFGGGLVVFAVIYIVGAIRRAYPHG